MAKRGPKPKSKNDLRQHAVTCRLTNGERDHVDRTKPSGMSRGEWLRRAALLAVPTKIPEVNVEAWSHAGKIAGGLTTLVKAITQGQIVTLDPEHVATVEALRRELAEIRKMLLVGPGPGPDLAEDEG